MDASSRRQSLSAALKPPCDSGRDIFEATVWERLGLPGICREERLTDRPDELRRSKRRQVSLSKFGMGESFIFS
jgi:hypothetical protein